MKIKTIAIIGAGNMGGALAKGLAKGRKIETSNIRISNPSPQKLEALKAEFPSLKTFQSNTEAIHQADMIILAVKPWKVKSVIEELKPHIDYNRQIVASMVGGLSIKEIDEMLKSKGEEKLPTVVYLIPNTAISICQSMTFFSTARSCSDIDNQLQSILEEVGDVMEVEERQMNAGMAVASCGIAFAMRYIRAAVESGVELGLRPQEALGAVLQTVKGAAMQLQESNQHPEAAIDNVTTAGGITIRGLNAMEEAGFSGAVIKAHRAAKP